MPTPAQNTIGPAQLECDPGRGHHADGHRFAVAEAEIAQPLQSVPDGMPKVEHGAVALFVRVAFDHADLDLKALGEEGGGNRVLGIRSDGFEFGQEIGGADDAVFDDLGHAGAYLLFRKG